MLQIEPLHSGSASRLVTKRRARADVVSGIGQEQRTLAASGRNLWTQPLDATSGRCAVAQTPRVGQVVGGKIG